MTQTAATPEAAIAGQNRLLTIEQVCEVTQLSARTIDRLEDEGRFPKRIDERRLGARARLYTARSIQRWMRDIDPNEEGED